MRRSSLVPFTANVVACFNMILVLSEYSVAMSTPKVIDSHLHVWADAKEASSRFPYAPGQDPPDSLKDSASTSALIKTMDESGVNGALIVQPINHKYDHSYVMDAIKLHPNRFKGMMLHDPSLPADQAISRLEDLASKGFVGVRFNPYLWPENDDDTGWVPMSSPDSAGLAVYKRCADLKIPVGVMCFQGLQLHHDDILSLLDASPETTMILDHFGFTSFTKDGESAFAQLLELTQYPQVVVKVSALFRLGDEPPYDRVRHERFLPLLEAFGPERLMFGTDFPFVLEQPGSYAGTMEMVQSWLEEEEEQSNAILYGTAERLFGPWSSKGSNEGNVQ